MMDEVIKIGRLSYESASIKDGTYRRAIKGGFLTDNGVVTPAAIRRVEWNNTMTINEEDLNKLRKSSSAHPNILRYFSYELQDNFLYVGYNIALDLLNIVEVIIKQLKSIFFSHTSITIAYNEKVIKN